MSQPQILSIRDCPVCGCAVEKGIPFLDRHITESKLSEFSYASRKTPEFMRYRMLRCAQCDVLYACEAPEQSHLSAAYHQAAYDSQEEALHAAEAYEKALLPIIEGMSDRQGVLDIGTGTGVFLQRMQANGFTGVVGVEPSRSAIDAAAPDIRSCIREGIFSEKDFSKESFAMITCFMTLEHVTDPAALVREAVRLLKPGGVFVAVVHDWRAWNNRVLGARAPIIDIEHLQLFSPQSARTLLERQTLTDVRCSSFANSYCLDYWNRLFPTPDLFKQALTAILCATGIGRMRLSMNVGNLILTSRKVG